MRKLFLVLMLSAIPATSFAHVRPHHAKHMTPAKSSATNVAGSSRTNPLLGTLYVAGAACLVGHLADFVRVGLIQGEKRRRTDKEVEFVWASCTVIGLPIWWARWGDGKRKPRPMPDVIDPRHNPVS